MTEYIGHYDEYGRMCFGKGCHIPDGTHGHPTDGLVTVRPPNTYTGKAARIKGDTMKHARKILSVTTHTVIDENPDLSHIGEYTDDLSDGVIVRALGEFVEKLSEDTETPTRGREYRGFRPYAGGEKVGTREYYKYGLQDFERMESMVRGNWCMVGIYAKAKVTLRTRPGVIQTLTSGGLWGVESDGGEAYLKEIRKAELQALQAELRAVGFTPAAIRRAFEDVQEKED